MAAQMIGRYEVVRELGRGGMATVYLARDPVMRRQVAIKVLPREFLHDPTFRARFEREAQAVAALEYPAIVPVYDFGEADGQPFIVMRYMTGGSLHDRLQRADRGLSLAEAARILRPLARALDRAHARGIIHRDLKPGNILFDEDDEPHLSDFGIARMAEASAAFTGTALIGTPAYMSPEQARAAKKLDGRADGYALGVILFEALTGDLPYRADTPIGLAIAHINDPVPSIVAARPDLPPACDEIIQRALAKNPDDRYQSAAELARAVSDLAGRRAAAAAADSVTIAEPYSPPLPGPAPIETPARTPPLPAPGPGLPAAGRRPQFSLLGLGGVGLALAAALILGVGVLGLGAFAVGRFFLPQTGATPNPNAAVTFINPADESVMVFVPAGAFVMGSGTGPADEQPQRTVLLDAYWIDQTEITNRQYGQCVAAGECDTPAETSSFSRADYYTNAAFADYPVVQVNWHDARAYCQWAGKHLPTEAEWEKAARGAESGVFPWGAPAPAASLANFGNGMGDTNEAGQYPAGASPYGALDMAGNVWEWTADWYGADYYRTAPDANPPGPASGTERALRGGSWRDNADDLRATNRFAGDPAIAYDNFGFRCARTP